MFPYNPSLIFLWRRNHKKNGRYPKSHMSRETKQSFIMKKILLSLIAVLFISVSFTSCATMFGKKTHPLALSSQPDGAEVYVNGLKMGVTPIQLNLKADKSYNIEFRKEGFENVVQIVNTEIGAGWLVLDVLGGVIPVVIDAATGNWNKLDQDAVNAALIKQKEVVGTN